LNYREHVKEGPNRDNIPKFPTIFMVVGQRTKHLTAANALVHRRLLGR
jgi:hypothetical protein